MSPLPHAQFEDPLLADRSRQRFAMWRSTMLNPWVVAITLGAVAGAWALLTPAFAAGVLALAMGMAWVDAGRLTERTWWARLVQQLGMRPDSHQVEALTPLLRSGQERQVLRAATDGRRRLLVFRSTDTPRVIEDDATKVHHDYTCVIYPADPFVTPAIRFLSAHAHRFAPAKWLGDGMRGRTVGDVEPFTVESVELHERFELRSSTVDGERARMLFSPTFITWFARQGISFEFESGDLVVIVDRALEHAEEYKLLLTRADEIHAALSRAGGPT